MSFHFSLDAVLRLRQSLEHQQELRLRAANQQIAKLRHLIDLVDHRGEQMRSQAARQMSDGATAAELRFGLLCQAELAKQRNVLAQEYLRVQKIRDEQQRLFEHVRRQREMVETLRERRFRDYQKDLARRKQRDLDEMFLLRSAHERLAKLNS
ncbi:MAG TPA: flagellar FliJ family protein [Verrucomicrobiae bacterium]|jgi:flagellar protein FliJ|nr:flagellar FliJ family protein [Verrucomicrobiae bacterium]